MDGETMSVRDMQDDVIETIRWEQQRAIEHRIRVARIFALLQLAFLGVSLSAWAACLVGRLSGLLPVDELTQRYIMSLTSSLMLFAVGTAIIEQFRGDMVGGFLGRALAGVGLFVMAAHGYELLQKATACEMWVRNQSAKPVEYMPVSYLREVEYNGMRVSYETKREPRNGRFRSVQSVLGSCAGADGATAGGDGRGYSMRGGAQRRSTPTDGSNAF